MSETQADTTASPATTDRPSFVKSNDTLILEHVLRECLVGETVSYETLSRSIKRDVRHEAKGHLTVARSSCERDGIVFHAVRNTGLRRLAPGEVVESADDFLNRQRRLSRRGRQRLEKVELSELNDDQKRSLSVKSAQLGAVELFTSKKAGEKLKKLPVREESGGRISMSETLRMFGSNPEADG